jgi:hypothetical protein
VKQAFTSHAVLVGAPVGATVGGTVGSTVGGVVGLLLGDVVGETVGVIVGATVGTTVGETDGACVGVAVGELEGARVGLTEGAPVAGLYSGSSQTGSWYCPTLYAQSYRSNTALIVSAWCWQFTAPLTKISYWSKMPTAA